MDFILLDYSMVTTNIVALRSAKRRRPPSANIGTVGTVLLTETA